MSANGTHPYYRKQRDTFMWAEFDALAGRLQMTISSALTEAAREWVEQHRSDPAPPREYPKEKMRPKPPPPDPFA